MMMTLSHFPMNLKYSSKKYDHDKLTVLFLKGDPEKGPVEVEKNTGFKIYVLKAYPAGKVKLCLANFSLRSRCRAVNNT
jgi:hypothetical protein